MSLTQIDWNPSRGWRGRSLVTAAFVALLLAGRSAYADEKTIEISNFSFQPGQLTVPVGTTVTWVNKDGEPHTVISLTGAFRSSALEPKQQKPRECLFRQTNIQALSPRFIGYNTHRFEREGLPTPHFHSGHCRRHPKDSRLSRRRRSR